MPGRLDQTRPFLPVNIAILTVSDTRDAAQDRSGNTLADLAASAGHHVVARKIVRDEQDAIVAQLRAWIADPEVDVVISTGGTGVTGRDVTPEAFPQRLRKGDRRFWRGLPLAQLRQDRHLDDPEPGYRRCGGRHLPIRVAGFAERLPRRLGRHSGPSTRQPFSAVQFRRIDAAPAGASEVIGRHPVPHNTRLGRRR